MSQSGPLVLLDLTRLIGATGRSVPTGIERVENQYADWLLSQSRFDVRFVMTTRKSVRLLRTQDVEDFLARQRAMWDAGSEASDAAAAISEVNAFLRDQTVDPTIAQGAATARTARIDQGIAAARRPFASFAANFRALRRTPVYPLLAAAKLAERPVVFLRASNDRMEFATPLERLKRFSNVSIVVLCHDVIPIDFPEYVRPSAVRTCAARLATMRDLTDGVVATSQYSADRLSAVLGAPDLPLIVNHLGLGGMRVPGSGLDNDEPSPSVLPDLANVPYFLVVSTIEARKNHLLLLQVWRRLVEEYGLSTPRLIIAGRRGWEAQAPLAILDRAQSLKRFVFEAGPVPDLALDSLVANAAALLMPSFVEGFGMPVIEALGAGTPVIASDIAVFRELVQGTAELIDPLDGPAWKEAIIAFGDPSSPRRVAAEERACNFRPRHQTAHFDALGDFIERIAATDAPRHTSPTAHPLGDGAVMGYGGTSG